MEQGRSYCSNLKSPWYCPSPNCGQTSMRRANMSVHMQRKHPGEFNPFELFKDPNYPYKKHNPQPPTTNDSASVLSQSPDYSGFFLPPIDFSDFTQVIERSERIQNLLYEIKRLSKKEQTELLFAIYNIQQSK